MSKKKTIIILVIALILIIVLSTGTIIVFNRKKVVFNKDFKYTGNYTEPLEIEDNYVFTNYDEYKAIFDNSALSKEDFQNNNYALIKVSYDSCADENIIPTDYKIKGNTIDVTIKYDRNCGVCAPEYLYFLLKIDKSITNPIINIKYETVKTASCDPYVSYKPMIYIYPNEDTKVTVKLGKPNNLTVTYPKYAKKWEIIAKKDGTLIDNNGRTYYGLYWEGTNNIKEDFNDGFIVYKEDLIPFFEEKLAILGLNEKESNEFIVYWLPILEKNDYNLIRFADESTINEQMPLQVDPNPDTIIRILMEYKKANKKDSIKEQKLIKKERTGYSVIEWGGTLIK